MISAYQPVRTGVRDSCLHSEILQQQSFGSLSLDGLQYQKPVELLSGKVQRLQHGVLGPDTHAEVVSAGRQATRDVDANRSTPPCLSSEIRVFLPKYQIRNS